MGRLYMSTLRNILPEPLSEGLTPAEEIVLDKAMRGEPADFTTGDEKADDPKNAGTWGPDRTIRPEFLYWLCTLDDATKNVHAKGVIIIGAKIDGDMDFGSSTLHRPLLLVYCAIGEIVLYIAETRFLNFSGCTTGPIMADGLSAKGPLFLKGTKVTGEVRLIGAEIDGVLDCAGAEFVNKGDDNLSIDKKRELIAFNADRVEAKDGMFLNDVKATGEVRLLGADIGGDLVCAGAQFDNPDGNAFSADRMKVKGTVFLRKAKAAGAVRLPGADIGGDFDCENAEFNNPSGMALNAIGLRAKGGVYLRNVFKATGEVNLLGADITGSLDCTGAKFENPNGHAFNADRIKVTGGVFLKVIATGTVRLPGADIGGDFDCEGASFSNPSREALKANGLKTKGSVYLRNGFKAIGEVHLIGANIGGDLDCTVAVFENKGLNAFSADRTKVKGGVFLRKTKASGFVSLIGVDISGDLECTRSEFENTEGLALACEKARINGVLFLDEMKPLQGVLDLMHAKVGALFDDNTGWPEEGKLCIDGFEYVTLAGPSGSKTTTERLRWLRLQPKKDNQGSNLFIPQPYEQLAKVFRQMGHESNSIKVLIAKYDDMLKYGNLSCIETVLRWLYGITMAHGYKVWRGAIAALVLLFIIGISVFNRADNIGVMQPSKERVYMDDSYKVLHMMPPEYPTFNPIVYSLDTLLPIVSLHQEDYWLPDANKPCGTTIRWYFWVHIALGWVFTTLAVASLTGLVRKE